MRMLWTLLSVLSLFVAMPEARAATDTVQSDAYQTVAYFAPDGKVQDASYRTLGYLGEGHVINAVVYFFFLDALKTQAR